MKSWSAWLPRFRRHRPWRNLQAIFAHYKIRTELATSVSWQYTRKPTIFEFHTSRTTGLRNTRKAQLALMAEGRGPLVIVSGWPDGTVVATAAKRVSRWSKVSGKYCLENVSSDLPCSKRGQKTDRAIAASNVPAPSVVALWHGNAPSLLVAFAKRRTAAPAVILVASDPRGDYLALLCRMLGFEVVRTDGRHGGWSELIKLAEKLKQGACVIITADGRGPARVAKWGAVGLASATGMPLVPLAADCTPALQQSHKWDDARNPLPFSSVSVWVGTPRTLEPLNDAESIERARSARCFGTSHGLQHLLNSLL